MFLAVLGLFYGPKPEDAKRRGAAGLGCRRGMKERAHSEVSDGGTRSFGRLFGIHGR